VPGSSLGAIGSIVWEGQVARLVGRRAGEQRLWNLGGEAEMGEDTPYHGGILDRGHEAQPATAGTTGKDVHCPRAAQKLRPRRVSIAPSAACGALGRQLMVTHKSALDTAT